MRTRFKSQAAQKEAHIKKVTQVPSRGDTESQSKNKLKRAEENICTRTNLDHRLFRHLCILSCFYFAHHNAKYTFYLFEGEYIFNQCQCSMCLTIGCCYSASNLLELLTDTNLPLSQNFVLIEMPRSTYIPSLFEPAVNWIIRVHQ